MSRKRINKEPLTSAEKQRRYREKQKAKIEALKAAAPDTSTVDPSPPPSAAAPAPDMAAIRETIKKELRETWEPELKTERIAEQRKEGRKLARRADKNHAQGRIEGICTAAAFFIGKDRADITKALLQHFMIDRETAAAALEADKRTRNITLASLDKSGAWEAPPSIIK